MFFPKLKLTDSGRALLSEVISGGGTLNFSGFALGDGALPEGEDGTHLTALIHQVGTVPIASITTGEGGVSLTAGVDTTQLPGAVTGRELGIFADALVGEGKILYAYTNAGDLATYIPQGSGDTYQRITLNVVVAVGDAEQITATIGGITGYATVEQLQEHESDEGNPHHVTKAQVGLGNVENLAINNQAPTYTEAESLQQLSSGETLRVAFGKIKKAIYDLAAHIGNHTNPHDVTPAQIGAANIYHEHSMADLTETDTRKILTSQERDRIGMISAFLQGPPSKEIPTPYVEGLSFTVGFQIATLTFGAFRNLPPQRDQVIGFLPTNLDDNNPYLHFVRAWPKYTISQNFVSRTDPSEVVQVQILPTGELLASNLSTNDSFLDIQGTITYVWGEQ